MSKQVDLNTSIFEISRDNPEIIEIMKELGFTDITKTGMINTVGKVMTISKGSRMKNIDMDYIKETFRSKGYEIID